MIITEFHGIDEYVVASCDRCGFRRKVTGDTSTMALLKLRCDCVKDAGKFGEPQIEIPKRWTET